MLQPCRELCTCGFTGNLAIPAPPDARASSSAAVNAFRAALRRVDEPTCSSAIAHVRKHPLEAPTVDGEGCAHPSPFACDGAQDALTRCSHSHGLFPFP